MPKPKQLFPFWQTTDNKTVKLFHGHALSVLKQLPSRSVQMVVTSPPYWRLREYNAGAEEIGIEKTSEEYVANLVLVFREVRRVLRNDGTVWLNLGDSYNGSGNLTGVPWRTALALQSDGWILRQDIIWHKPAPMPESVKNRCTSAHEYLFLLAAHSNYYYDREAIGSSYKGGSVDRTQYSTYNNAKNKLALTTNLNKRKNPNAEERNSLRVLAGALANKRSVWSIPSGEGYSGNHGATYPPKLIEPCILAGTSDYGACIECGGAYHRDLDGLGVNTVGWKLSHACDTEEVRPCVVLDPFIGSGTTAVVCLDHGRYCWGIDLNAEYLKSEAILRVEGALLRRPCYSNLIPREIKRVVLGGLKGIKT